MNASPPRRLSSAHRYLFVLCLGLLIGLIATVMVGRALQARRDPFPGSLMQVMQRQSQLLQQAQLQNRCSLADSVPRLQVLRLLSNDLDQAFPGLKHSAQFQQHASQLRGNLNTALASPPGDCRALAQLVETLQAECRACHQDFR
ncbi:cytochrome c [Stenotrophomonas maltophilia]|nr:cytochrome c [Stenotrophomonas maltophilia]